MPLKNNSISNHKNENLTKHPKVFEIKRRGNFLSDQFFHEFNKQFKKAVKKVISNNCFPDFNLNYSALPSKDQQLSNKKFFDESLYQKNKNAESLKVLSSIRQEENQYKVRN